MSIYSHEFLSFNHANSKKVNLFLLVLNILIIALVRGLSLDLTKTDYEMRFNIWVIPCNDSILEIINQISWLRDTWHGCDNLGTAYEFSTRSAGEGHDKNCIKIRPLSVPIFSIIVHRAFWIDDYAKDGGLRAVWLLCSLYHDPLRAKIIGNLDNFTIWARLAFKSKTDTW